MTRTASRRSPSSVFRSITDPPYLPPTSHTESLLLTLFPSAPNPDLEPTALPAETDRLLPKPPLGSAHIANTDAREATIASWRRHLRRNPPGAPDGTGISGALFAACTDSFPLLALWLDALLHARSTPSHRRLLASQTLGGKLKPNKSTGELPAHAADATAARPLARCPITRRLVAGYLSRFFYTSPPIRETGY